MLLFFTKIHAHQETSEAPKNVGATIACRPGFRIHGVACHVGRRRELVSSKLHVHATVHRDIHHMRHVGHLDDHASAGRNTQGSWHPRKICGAPAGASIS